MKSLLFPMGMEGPYPMRKYPCAKREAVIKRNTTIKTYLIFFIMVLFDISDTIGYK
jgi:hypothetical protein